MVPDRRTLIAALAATGADVAATEDAQLVYEHDGSTLHGARPAAVAFPTSTAQVAALVAACAAAGVPFVARGAGTGLSGGAMALDGGVVLACNRMDRILALDPLRRRATLQPGVANLAVSRAAAAFGLHYAPDPSSQAVCTVGGNVAHNSGGPHTLRHGVTVNHVLGLELVLPDGQVARLGGPERAGYDLLALLCGSEGTLGIVTEITVRLLPRPQAARTLLAAFPSPDEAGRAVAALIAGGALPSALEMMDAVVVQALEAAFAFRFPAGAGALLLVECDGPAADLDEQVALVQDACRAAGALSVRVAADEAERAEIWKARKRAFGALGRLARNYCTQDGVIPRTRLPEVLKTIRGIGERFNLRIANVFHAGDGNLHPNVMFDERVPGATQQVLDLGEEIMRLCVDAGGSITGEHGVGVEKIDYMPLLFSPTDLEVMARVKSVFNPDNLCNPGKIFPTNKGCLEVMLRRRSVAL